jgi:hypothetical protein
MPDWAREERESDFAWIAENRSSFWPAAQAQFSAHGRGVIVVDTTQQPDPNAANPMYYIVSTQVEQTDDEDTKRMLREYDPSQEFVVLLLKPEGHASTYRYRVQPVEKVQRGRPPRRR